MTTDEKWEIAQARLEGRCIKCNMILPEHDVVCPDHVNTRISRVKRNLEDVLSKAEAWAEKKPRAIAYEIEKMKGNRDV